jgi:OOP family OmpA-OmpF porin
LVAAGFVTASWLRWRRAVRAIGAEPGFVLVDASRSWGRRWQFRGLKDPMARDPRVVLTAAGLTPPTIIGEWKPYLSLDSAMVVARARQTLAAPTSATTELASDTLRIAGSASIDWLARLRGAPSIAGVAHVDYSAARATLPAGIDDLRRRLEAKRILFAPGSSAIPAADAVDMAVLAAMVRQLSDSVAAIGAALRVDLVGRTDPTGTDATNQSLAQLRVDEVMRRLRALRVPAAILNGRPLATAQPLSAADADEQARINRSVSFEAVVTTGLHVPRGP